MRHLKFRASANAARDRVSRVDRVAPTSTRRGTPRAHLCVCRFASVRRVGSFRVFVGAYLEFLAQMHLGETSSLIQRLQQHSRRTLGSRGRGKGRQGERWSSTRKHTGQGEARVEGTRSRAWIVGGSGGYLVRLVRLVPRVRPSSDVHQVLLLALDEVVVRERPTGVLYLVESLRARRGRAQRDGGFDS